MSEAAGAAMLALNDNDAMIQKMLNEASAELVVPQCRVKAKEAAWKWRKYGTKVRDRCCPSMPVTQAL